MVKNLPAIAGNARDTGLIPGSGRSLGGGSGNLAWRIPSDTAEHRQTHTLQWLYRHLRHTDQQQELYQTVQFSSFWSLSCV